MLQLQVREIAWLLNIARNNFKDCIVIWVLNIILQFFVICLFMPFWLWDKMNCAKLIILRQIQTPEFLYWLISLKSFLNMTCRGNYMHHKYLSCYMVGGSWLCRGISLLFEDLSFTFLHNFWSSTVSLPLLACKLGNLCIFLLCVL
jgi:hypothetical protein